MIGLALGPERLTSFTDGSLRTRYSSLRPGTAHFEPGTAHFEPGTAHFWTVVPVLALL